MLCLGHKHRRHLKKPVQATCRTFCLFTFQNCYIFPGWKCLQLNCEARALNTIIIGTAITWWDLMFNTDVKEPWLCTPSCFPPCGWKEKRTEIRTMKQLEARCLKLRFDENSTAIEHYFEITLRCWFLRREFLDIAHMFLFEIRFKKLQRNKLPICVNFERNDWKCATIKVNSTSEISLGLRFPCTLNRIAASTINLDLCKGLWPNN